MHKTFKPTVQDKRDLTAARKNYAKGNYVTLDVLYNDLAWQKIVALMSNSETVKAIKQGKEDIKKGRVKKFEELFGMTPGDAVKII